MPKPLTLQDIKNAFKGQALLLEKRLKQMLTKQDAKAFLTKQDAKNFLTKQDAKNFLTKQDAKNFLTKQDAKSFATKDDVKALSNKQEADKQEIIAAFKEHAETYAQVRLEEREELHQDELDIVTGKKDASPKWNSIPRRLFTAEQNIEKIKDHLEIS